MPQDESTHSSPASRPERRGSAIHGSERHGSTKAESDDASNPHAPSSAPSPAPDLARPSRRTVLTVGALGTAALAATGAAVGPLPSRLGAPQGDPDLAAAIAPCLDGCRTVTAALIEGGAVRWTGFGADQHREFEIGSVSKTFTGALVMAAVARGEIALETTVADVLGSRADGSAIADVTVAELVSHTSGLPRLPSAMTTSSIWRNALRRDPYTGFNADEVVDMALAAEISGRGTVAYSNLGPSLAAHLLAEATGSPWEDLLAQRILRPLGMPSTRAPITLDALAQDAPRGRTASGRRTGPWTFEGFAPAGGIRSNLADMIAYLRSLMDGSNPGAAGLEPIATREEGSHVAVSWFLEPLDSGARAVWHNGQTGGFASFCGWSPDTGRGWVLLSDTARPTDERTWMQILDGKVI